MPSNANGKRRRIDLERVGEHTFRTTLSAELIYFEGHFDGFPLLPAVAQLTRLVMPLVRREHPDLGDLQRLRRARFRRPLEPGAVIDVSISRVGEQVSLEIRLGEQVAASGVLHFHWRPAPAT